MYSLGSATKRIEVYFQEFCCSCPHHRFVESTELTSDHLSSDISGLHLGDVFDYEA